MGSDDIISKHLLDIQENLRTLPKLELQISALAETTRDLGVVLRESVVELRAMDAATNAEMQALKQGLYQTNTGMAALSTIVTDLRSELSKRVEALEKQVQSLFSAILKFGDKTSKLDSRIQVLESRDDRKDIEISKEFIIQWNPWLKAIRWALTIIAGMLVTALAGALLWALIQSNGSTI